MVKETGKLGSPCQTGPGRQAGARATLSHLLREAPREARAPATPPSTKHTPINQKKLMSCSGICMVP